jgi:hypothetical protein
MKISDPLGKVYQHTMFKKKSYNMAAAPAAAESRARDSEDEEDDEEEDEGSEVSEQTDDSLSTKSSRVAGGRGRSSSRARTSKEGRVSECMNYETLRLRYCRCLTFLGKRRGMKYR